MALVSTDWCKILMGKYKLKGNDNEMREIAFYKHHDVMRKETKYDKAQGSNSSPYFSLSTIFFSKENLLM